MSTNQDIVDASIAHQIDLQHYANGVVREEVGALNEDDAEIFAMLLAALLSLPQNATPAQIDTALGPALMMSDRSYADVSRDLAAKMEDMVEAEAEYQAALLAKSQPKAPDKLDTGATFGEMMAVPIIGMTIAETMRSLAESRKATIRNTVQAGFVNGQTAEEIVRSLRGTRAANFTDGLFNRARTALETTVRTALSHAAEYTSAAFHALNSDIVRAVVWLSVLDSATSSWCIARAGKRYTADAAHRPIGHNYDWGAGPGRYHYNCRSTFAPLVAGEVPNANRFADWLKKQPAKVQDDVLGPTRGNMYRSGQVGVEGFLNNKGKLLTLEQLKAKNAGLS
jgi:hypothetical protein